MIRPTLACLALATLALTGCSSSGKAATAGPTCDHACQASSIEAELSTGGSAPDNGLTGFGASLSAWNAHHDADPDSKLAPNCCYRPAIPFFGQSELQDTWVAVQSDGGVISGFMHDFSPNTHRDQALAEIETEDLPDDAKLVDSKVGDGCELFLFKSAKLGAADHDLGPYVNFDFVSPPDETVYYPDNIWHADLSTSGPTLPDC